MCERAERATEKGDGRESGRLVRLEETSRVYGSLLLVCPWGTLFGEKEGGDSVIVRGIERLTSISEVEDVEDSGRFGEGKSRSEQSMIMSLLRCAGVEYER